MMSNWIGYAVSVNCGEPLGCYQGRILEADGATITLTKAFRNGFPYPKSKVTLNAADIKDLKIIEEKPETSEQTQHSTVPVTKSSKKGHRATVCENLQANSSSGGQVVNTGSSNKNVGTRSGSGPARSKPIDIQGARGNKHNNNHSGSFGAGGGSGSTPRARGSGGSGGAGGGAGGAGAGGGGGGGGRRRNDACFAGADDDLSTDFDFEKNLALFDKQALWDQMRNSHKPDVVRQTEKYRHDENVLGGGGGGGARSTRVPLSLQAVSEYLTDEGVGVPSLTWAGRALAWRTLRAAGAQPQAELLLARAAADVALRLVGGGRRLEARNTHQVPTVVALLATNFIGGVGAQCARLLTSHGVRCVAHILQDAGAGAGQAGAGAGQGAGEYEEEALRAQLAQYEVAACELAALPAPDLVLIAVGDEDPPHYRAAMSWCGEARGGALRVEAGAGAGAGGAGRAALWALLPPVHRAALGATLLANVAPPPVLWRQLRVLYVPPFADHTALTLHPQQ